MTPEQIEFHRKRFEEYYAGDIKLERKGNGNYIYMQAHIAWMTWIAAIESIDANSQGDIEKAFMAGQIDAGIDPSYSSAKAYSQSLGLKVKER